MRGLTGTAVTRRGLGGELRGECFLSLEAVSVLTVLSLTAWSVPVPKVSESARGESWPGGQCAECLWKK